MFRGARAVIATLHGKERVIGPLLDEAIGLSLRRVEVDTDAFGTFTGETPRLGTMRDAARRKTDAALAAAPDAAFAVASEGSFGPHPQLGFVASNLELVVLVSREGLAIEGTARSLETNHGHTVAASVEEVVRFARAHHFPSHAMCVMPARGGLRHPEGGVVKGLVDEVALVDAVERVLSAHGAVHVESDMRAHLNPMRQGVIAQATRNLLAWATTPCPACARPGFRVTAQHPGLPCGLCGTPTASVATETWGCPCGHTEQRPARHGQASVDPAHCPRCNP